jgi:hypothetical protein
LLKHTRANVRRKILLNFLPSQITLAQLPPAFPLTNTTTAHGDSELSAANISPAFSIQEASDLGQSKPDSAHLARAGGIHQQGMLRDSKSRASGRLVV